jgi:hypothetical protein
VPPIAGPEAFLTVATGRVPVPAIPADIRLDADELRAISEAAEKVTLPQPVERALLSLWQTSATDDWTVSDRRWRQAVSLLRVAAASDGRTEVSTLDLLLLQSVLPPTPDRGPEIREALLGQLGAGAIPQHDLRAQWHLMRGDRVASAGLPPAADTTWEARLTARKRSLAQFLTLHSQAVQRLAADRASIEDVANQHLWLDRLPPPVLAAHIEASRDLSHILATAERYQQAISNPKTAGAALLQALPTATRRAYGQGAVCSIALDGGPPVGLTLAGQREAPKHTRALGDDGLVRPAREDAPVLHLATADWVAWLDGEEPPEALLASMPAWASRNVASALREVRKQLGGSGIVPPPALPPP